jgi:DNA repair protein RadA/Sms
MFLILHQRRRARASKHPRPRLGAIFVIEARLAKTRTIFVCQQCGSQQTRWMGKCPDCGTWDSLVEQVERKETGTKNRGSIASADLNRPLPLRDVPTGGFERLPVLGDEFARVLGGGMVPGSLVLIGGDPGIGKSTLLGQVAAQFSDEVGPALYISAEESVQQIKLRMGRMGLDPAGMLVYSETSLDAILEQIEAVRPRLVVVDSIQTVYLEDITSAAGSVSQVREGALRLLRLAKSTGIPVFLVGHVTKEGAIAGPRVLEHIVDVVLYLEGERFHQYRLLRGVKNRFGSTDEVGVFEMTQGGMREVSNPSQVFLAERSAGTPGSTVAVTMEGTRPLLVEVQALTSNTASAQPRRTANGFDMNRLLMLIAVLSKRVGLPLFNQDIYVNIVGGLRITEPAADLAVAVAIASSYRNQRVRPDLVLVGEVGLSGEMRSVGQLDRRLTEAAKLGFTQSLYPSTAAAPSVDGLSVAEVRSVAEAVDLALERGDQGPRTKDQRSAVHSQHTEEDE